LAPVADDAGAAGAVEGVVIGPRLQEELVAEAVHADAAIGECAQATFDVAGACVCCEFSSLVMTTQ
jgi:hypothetical protein